MANSYFQFKQFTVYQDRSTLKVTTDSCLFGAWVAQKVTRYQLKIHQALDIGAGTGLLMLMLAQKFAGTIHGIEIDKDSYEQAAENVRASRWNDRLVVFHDDIKLFQLAHQYDLIICNPPFFEGDLKSISTQKNLAKHNDGLPLSELLEVTDRNLSEKGKFAVLLPFNRVEYIEQLAASYKLFVTEKLLVRQSLKHPYFRCALMLNRINDGLPQKEELLIKVPGNTYSLEFKELMKDYYLYL